MAAAGIPSSRETSLATALAETRRRPTCAFPPWRVDFRRQKKSAGLLANEDRVAERDAAEIVVDRYGDALFIHALGESAEAVAAFLEKPPVDPAMVPAVGIGPAVDVEYSGAGLFQVGQEIVKVLLAFGKRNARRTDIGVPFLP